MASQRSLDSVYMNIAAEVANLSHCKRSKVGALIVKDNNILSFGYNGSPSGIDNCCEDKLARTHWWVLHAESNAVAKVAKSTQSSENATLYTTLSPCNDCSKIIIQAGITRVVYKDLYEKSQEGLDLMLDLNIKIDKWEQEV